MEKLRLEEWRESIQRQVANLSSAQIAVGFALGTAVAYTMWKIVKSRNLPPGPTGFPVCGNYLQLGSDPPATFAKWSQTYGKTISVRLGSKLMVIMHDFDTAKEVLNQDVAMGRDQDSVLQMMFKGKGLIQEEGDLLKEQRRFARSALHPPQAWLENIILNELTELEEYFDDLKGYSIDPRQHLIHAIANIIAQITLGARFPHNDAAFNGAANLIGDTIRRIGQLTPLAAPPMWQHIPIGSAKDDWRAVLDAVQKLVKFVEAPINGHRSKMSTVDDQPDYVDLFLKEQNANPNSGFQDDQLLLSVLNLFAPGAETITSSLLWAFLYMLENPAIAQKVKQELDDNCLQQVFLEDKEKLPYVEATLMECLRLGSTVPLGIYHSSLAEMTIDGYQIPERTTIVANTYAIHRDSQYWSDGEAFRPERFLDSVGKLRTPKGYMPFYVGKRSCLAEHFAETVLFLTFANMMHRYEIRRPSEVIPSSKEAINGLLRSPLPYKACFVNTLTKLVTDTQIRNA